jgi:hypothetical protein
VPARSFEDPPLISRQQALEAFLAGDPVTISTALVSVSLNDDDGRWVEEQCWRLAEHADAGVRGTAGLCLGHVARRFGTVRRRSWVVVRRLCDDESVDNRPCDGLDDLRKFAGPEPGA